MCRGLSKARGKTPWKASVTLWITRIAVGVTIGDGFIGGCVLLAAAGKPDNRRILAAPVATVNPDSHFGTAAGFF
jgi:hypothetical protein